MHERRVGIRTILTAGAIGVAALATTAANAGDSFKDRWKRDPRGAFETSKSALALKYCIATGISDVTFPTVMHGEGLTEIDSYQVQVGFRIQELQDHRLVTFVSNPRAEGHAATVIKDCI